MPEVDALDGPAPEIDLPDDEDGRWRLSDQRGVPVLVIFHRHLA